MPGIERSEDEKVQALVMDAEGMTGRQIADRLGVHYTTVYRWLDELGEARSELAEDVSQGRIHEKARRLYEYKVDAALEDPDSVSLIHAATIYGITDDKGTNRRKLSLQKEQGDQRSEDMHALREVMRIAIAQGNTLPSLPEASIDGEYRES